MENMIENVIDVLGNELKVNDKIAFGDTTSTHNAFLNFGEIIDIKKKNKITEVYVKIISSGYSNHDWYIGQIQKFKYPRYYNNFIKVS